ncbi:uncharacterized protein LOC142324560 [Lycorma delicatula]|uniref:uncharacterized protein LOC142324560 n=1 Tax=Lycorma delicatula TaxID=130591 RepID=UPI003F519228
MASLFLFGSAHTALWKRNVGTAIAVLNPSVLESKKESNDEAVLSVNNPDQVMVCGQLKDFGFRKGRFNLYLKLMLVMGIPWISDILEIIFPSLDLLWQIMFTFNLFQGVMMFIIFICNKRILHAINIKLWPSKIIFTYNESSSKNSKATETFSSRCMQG